MYKKNLVLRFLEFIKGSRPYVRSQHNILIDNDNNIYFVLSLSLCVTVCPSTHHAEVTGVKQLKLHLAYNIGSN